MKNKEWKDWLSNEELNDMTHNSMLQCSIEDMEIIISKLMNLYEEQENWIAEDVASNLIPIQDHIASGERYWEMDCVFAIDLLENDGWYLPDRETFDKCLERVCKYFDIEL